MVIIKYARILLLFFSFLFTTGITLSMDQHLQHKQLKVVTVSVKPLDELQVYNDTAFSVTIVVHDANNEHITYQVTLAPGETFYKNARCRTANGKRKLAKLVLCDIGGQKTRMLLYPMRTEFNNDVWHSVTVQVSEILNK